MSITPRSGDASYSIYLSHLFTINVVGRVWKIFAVDAVLDNIIALLVAFILAIVAGIIRYWYVETPLLNLTRKAA